MKGSPWSLSFVADSSTFDIQRWIFDIRFPHENQPKLASSAGSVLSVRGGLVPLLEGGRSDGDALAPHIVQNIHLVIKRAAGEDLEDTQNLLQALPVRRHLLLHLLDSDPHAITPEPDVTWAAGPAPIRVGQSRSFVSDPFA